MGGDGVAQVFEYRSLLLGACGDRSPDSFAPSLPAPAAGALGDAAVDDHVAYDLFSRVVDRVGARCGDETETGIAVKAKTPLDNCPREMGMWSTSRK